MNLERIRQSPVLVRVLPFVIFLGLTACQGQFGEASRYWFYLAKTLVGGWLLLTLAASIPEMRWTFSGAAVIAGIGVFALWVGLDGHYPSMQELLSNYVCPVLKKVGLSGWCPGAESKQNVWNPHQQFGSMSGLAWLFTITRILGSTLVVPPLEEVFYRSFLYRYIAKPDFEKVSLGLFIWKPFLATSLIFGFAHHEWLPAILCGIIYQGLVCWTKRLGDAITAHAITNCLLGLWVVWKGDWHFW